MARYDPKELLKRWVQERLTADQAIGQLIQHIIDLQKQIDELKTRLNGKGGKNGETSGGASTPRRK